MMKIADGYTMKTFTLRKNLMDFLENAEVFNDGPTGTKANTVIE